MKPVNIPSSDLRWGNIDPDDYPVPIHYQVSSIQTVLTDFKDSYRSIISTVESINADELFTPGYYPWTGAACVADYLALCTYRHYEWAKGHIRRWRKTHPGEYLNKEIIIERIRTERRRLEKNLESLGDEWMETPGVVDEWTVKDLLAHLADWETRFLGWYAAGLRGETPAVPAPGISWEQIDLLNQSILQKNRERSLDQVQVEFHSSHKKVIETIEAIPEKDIFEVGKYAWLGDGNLVGFILANTANHYRWANQKIREWHKKDET